MFKGPFRFDARAHRYTVGARVVPGIHSVLKHAGYEQTDSPWFTPEHQARGSAIHLATLHHDLGQTVRLPAEWRGYFDAYLGLLAAVTCRWHKLEHPKVHRGLGCATIIDRVGTVNGRQAIVELKTGYPEPWHAIQLAGAHIIYNAPRPLNRLSGHARIAFYLQSDGRFRVREYDGTNDHDKFVRAVQGYWDERW